MDLVKCIGPVGHSNVTQLQTGGGRWGAGLGHGGGQLPPMPPSARAAHAGYCKLKYEIKSYI